MKKTFCFIIYLLALAAGILLLIYNDEPLRTENTVTLRSIVIGTGIIFTAGGLINLLFYIKKRKNPDGSVKARPWYLLGMSLVCAFWGILMMALSYSLTYTLAITLGICLIFAAIVQTSWLAGFAKKETRTIWAFIIPVVTICVGVADIVLVSDHTNFSKSSSTACIISGITAILFAANGILTLRKPASKRIEEKVAADEAKATDELKKKGNKEEKPQEAKQAKVVKEETASAEKENEAKTAEKGKTDK